MKNVFLMLVAFTNVIVNQSCNQNDSVVETTNQSKVDTQFLKLGISKRTYNEKVNLLEIKGLEDDSFARLNSVSNADEVFHYTDGSKAYIFNIKKGNVDENKVIKVNSNNDLLGVRNIKITNVVDNLNYTTIFTDENNVLVSANIVDGILQKVDAIDLEVRYSRKINNKFGSRLV